MDTTLEQKITATDKPAAKDDVSFSWRSVYRRWMHNMKEDIDPALGGAKIATYALHGWSTWAREYSEGKLASRNRTITTITGLVAGAGQVGAYYAASQLVNAATNPVSVNGTPVETGYAVFGIPVVANAVSWSKEAFRRAKKEEIERVVLTRVSKAIDSPAATYDLSCAELRDRVMQQISPSYGQTADYDPNEGFGHRSPTKRTKSQTAGDGSSEKARLALTALAKDVLDGLYAEGQLGKTYETTSKLHVGSPTREFQNGQVPSRDQGELERLAGYAMEIITSTVKEKGGSAEIELLGRVTTVYSATDAKGISYRVTPNAIWKV